MCCIMFSCMFRASCIVLHSPALIRLLTMFAGSFFVRKMQLDTRVEVSGFRATWRLSANSADRKPSAPKLAPLNLILRPEAETPSCVPHERLRACCAVHGLLIPLYFHTPLGSLLCTRIQELYRKSPIQSDILLP